ncbi:helix-turn-helix domain-containing protein [Azotobacter salinestris]|uniref:helix-turn-helix domain-containing protein n=1 Tax=Azotobacter salinestris TaxID=69964 RepID=UPI0032E048F7
MSFQAMAWAVDQKLPTLQKFVLLMLANRTNHDTGRCDPSHKRLADDCGMSVASVKRAIKALAEAGYLSVEGRTKNGEKQPNYYRLHLDRVGSHRPDPMPNAGGVGSQGTEVGSHRPDLGSDRPEGVGSQGAINQESSKQEVNQEENLKSLPAMPADADMAAMEGEVLPAEQFADDKPRCEIPDDMPGPKDQSCKTFKAWANYAMAYRKRYSVWPVWNAQAGGMLGKLIDLIGTEAAPKVAAFYVSINDARLVNDCHSLNNLIAKAGAYHTQWLTGRQMNGTTARQIEQTQANINAAEEAARRILERGERNEFL